MMLSASFLHNASCHALAETPPAVLVDLDLTPNDVFYVRHHLPVPLVEDEKTFALHIDTPHGTVARLSMDDLRGLPRVAVTATLQCAGNRRKEMKVAGPVQGLSWDRGAIGNATWWGRP